jgi:hypothetical protein
MNQYERNFCPVPKEQQPVNEYQQLTNSWFFRWVTFSFRTYIEKLCLVWGISQLIVIPISSVSFPPQKASLAFMIADFLGGSFFVTLALIRLYLGWSYVGNRLNSEKIVYEESGWYDGQEWDKPPEILTRDRLIFAHQVKPILKRLQNSGLILMGLIGSGSLMFLWL